MDPRRWRILRRSLLVVLLFAVLGLFGMELSESLRRSRASRMEPAVAGSAPSGFVKPATEEESDHLLMQEVITGAKNRAPDPLGFVFQNPLGSKEDPCAWQCLDQPVADGLDVQLIGATGASCRTKTLKPILWKGEGRTRPATPLLREPSCDALGEILMAVFGAEVPEWEWIDLQKTVADDAPTRRKFAANTKLRDRLIEASAAAEGTLILPESVQPLPPEHCEFDVDEGKMILETVRFQEPRDDGKPGEARRGWTEYRIGPTPARRLPENGLFCSEVLSAFRWQGHPYLVISESGCNSDLRCRGILEWRDQAFRMIYGNCDQEFQAR